MSLPVMANFDEIFFGSQIILADQDYLAYHFVSFSLLRIDVELSMVCLGVELKDLYHAYVEDYTRCLFVAEWTKRHDTTQNKFYHGLVS